MSQKYRRGQHVTWNYAGHIASGQIKEVFKVHVCCPSGNWNFWLIELIDESKEALAMTRSRRIFTADEKAAIVRRHLIDKVPVSDLSDEFGLQPTQIYTWQKQLFDNAALAFAKPGRKPPQDDAKDRKIKALQAKIQLKNEVVAELR